MKTLIVGSVTLVLAACAVGTSLAVSSERSYERSLYATSFDQVDWSSLTALAGDREQGNGEVQLLCERNLKYIFHHKLNRRQFLVAPRPQVVVDRIVSIMEASQRLTQMLTRARTFLANPPPREDSRIVVQEVGRVARDIRSQFNSFFLESHAGSYSFQVPRSGDPSAQFTSFLLQSQVINRELTQRLDDYFFDDSPGSVRLEQMQAGNISALAESLEVLAGAVNRNLR
jgi:hypothetical protein